MMFMVTVSITRLLPNHINCTHGIQTPHHLSVVEQLSLSTRNKQSIHFQEHLHFTEVSSTELFKAKHETQALHHYSSSKTMINFPLFTSLFSFQSRTKPFPRQSHPVTLPFPESKSSEEKPGFFLCSEKAHMFIWAEIFVALICSRLTFFNDQSLRIHLETARRNLILRIKMLLFTFLIVLLSFIPHPCKYQVISTSPQVFPNLTIYCY